jgi:hypothetical protein
MKQRRKSLDEQGSVNCLQCKYYQVTWDPAAPRGCSYYQFKSPYYPSYIVFESSGHECFQFTPKNQAATHGRTSTPRKKR